MQRFNRSTTSHTTIGKPPPKRGYSRATVLAAVATTAIGWLALPLAAMAQPTACEPRPDGFGCAQVQCPTGQQCVPVRIRRFLDGQFRIIECGCRPTNSGCRLQFTGPTTEPVCVGPCPTGQECRLISSGNLDGTIDYTCECRDPNVPDTCGSNTGSNSCRGACPPGMACVPVVIRRTTTGTILVIRCDCRGLTECRPVVTNTGGIQCVGGCPDGSPCRTITTTNPDGSIDITCDCTPPPPQCQPDAQGQACLPTPCSDPTNTCVPTLIRRDANGRTFVVQCDCLPIGACHVEFVAGNPEPICVGNCPAGFTCELVRTPNADGSIDYSCRCVPIPVCEPRDDGLACRPIPCTNPGETCVPVKIRRGANGGFRVIECRCQPDGACHVDYSPNVPEPFCVGQCPTGFTCELVRTTNTDGTVDYECRCVPIPVCEPNATGNACQPVTCPIAGQRCVPTLIRGDPNGRLTVVECNCLPDGACHVEIVAGNPEPICVGNCPAGFTCELVRTPNADGSIDYSCRCAPIPVCEPRDDGLACRPIPCTNPGETCVPVKIRRGANGGFRVIECRCQPDGACHVDYSPNVPEPFCVGQCPTGFTCELVRTTNTDGTVDYECRCVPITVCEPNATGNACQPVTCPIAGQRCVPTLIRGDPNGRLTVVECNCLPDGACHVEIVAGNPEPICVGNCPTGQTCELVRTPNPVGGIDYSCRCVPIPVCEPRDDGLACRPIPCTNPGETCVPVRIRRLSAGVFRVIECRCQPDGACHVAYSPNVPEPFCVGQCPTGFTCELVRTTNTDGTVDYECRCVPVVVCEPTTAGDRCNQTPCPDPTERCLPVRVRYNPATGQGRVIECDCIDPTTCHLEFTPGTLPNCVGICPPGFVCEQRLEFNSDNTVDFTCRCVPVAPCQPTTTGSGCNPTQCPVNTQECVPVRVNYHPITGATRVLACDCLDPNQCHVVLTNAIPPPCIGGCPPDMRCRRSLRRHLDGSVDIDCRCVGRFGACCLMTTQCINNVDRDTCVQQFGGVYQGDGSVCGQSCICAGDLTGDNRVDGDDINDFVMCYILADPNGQIVCPCPCADMNNDGMLSQIDLRLFVLELLYRTDTACEE